MSRIVCWWSAGVASTVAAKLTIRDHRNAIVAYCDTSASEHPDNERYLADCEKWLGVSILRLASDKYTDTWDVFERTRFLVSPGGARCTTELKKKVRRAFEEPGDVNVFGYTAEERQRCTRFAANNPEIIARFPLVEAELSHSDCLAMVERAGIELPAMYRLGYANNNCIGCVKGGRGYWNKIRRDFPKTFERMAKLERSLGVSIDKDTYLDQLDPTSGRHQKESKIECGLFCHAAEKP